MRFREITDRGESESHAILIEQNVQKLLQNPRLLRTVLDVVFIDREIAALDRLTDQVMYQVMKKKPKRVEQMKEACVGA